MKTNIDDATLQAAIDEALEKVGTSSGSLVSKFHYPNTFLREAEERLRVAKSFLDRLPEPPPPVVDGKTPGQVAYEAFTARAFGGQASLEAERLKFALMGAQQGLEEARRAIRKLERQLEDTQKSSVPSQLAEQADPYAELKAAYAEGKRIQIRSKDGSKWSDWSFPVEPLWNTPPNRYRIKPEPAQPWQPAVGDKVKLKGGSFTMTVEQADSDGIACEWHDSNGVPQARTYTPEILQPA